MAVEIANLAAAVCSVNVPPRPQQGEPLPKFFGPGTRQFANVGFAPWAAFSVNADLTHCVRIGAGLYHMHALQNFTFAGGQVGAIATLNVRQDQKAIMLANNNVVYPPGINALGVDLGGNGTNVFIEIGGGIGGGEDPTTADGDFTLQIVQYPTQQTPPPFGSVSP